MSLNLKTSSELQLLLSCAKPQTKPKIQTALKTLLNHSIDWKLVLTAAKEHGLTPLLYNQLRIHHFESVPQPVCAQLEEYVQKTHTNNFRLTVRLMEVLQLFSQNHIASIPYKGPTLSQRLYGNIALREFGDIDLIIHEEDFPKIQTLLSQAGYLPFHRLSSAQEKAYRKFHYEIDYYHPEKPFLLELHTNVVRKAFLLTLKNKDLWHNLKTTPFKGESIFQHASNDLLRLLILHGSKEIWLRLIWLVDIANLIVQEAKDLDFQQLIAQAKEEGTLRLSLLALKLVHSLFEISLPKEVRVEWEKDPKINVLESLICANILRPKVTHPNALETLKYYFFLRENLRDGLRYCCSLAFTPGVGDWQKTKLPDSLLFLHPVLRPFRLLKGYGVKQSAPAEPAEKSFH